MWGLAPVPAGTHTPFRAGKPSLRRMGIPAFSRDGSLCQNSWIGLHGNDREISYGMGRFSLSENQAALEFECFRMLSYGYAVSIGDQLEPYGVLNPAAYQLIGKVFHQLKEREAWARPSKALVEAALVTSEPIPASIRFPKVFWGRSAAGRTGAAI